MNKRFFLFIVIFLSVFNIFYFYKKSKNEERLKLETQQRKLEIVHKYHVEMEINDKRSELTAHSRESLKGPEVQQLQKISGTEFTIDQVDELLAKEVSSRFFNFDLQLSEFQNEKIRLNEWLKKIYASKKMVFIAETTIRANDLFDLVVFLDVYKCPGNRLAEKEINYKEFCLKSYAYLYNHNAKKGDEKWYQYNAGTNVGNIVWDFDVPSMPVFLSMDVDTTKLLRLQLPLPSFSGPLLYYHLGGDKVLWDKNENFSWEESTSLEQKEFEQNIVNKNLAAIFWKKFKQDKNRASK